MYEIKSEAFETKEDYWDTVNENVFRRLKAFTKKYNKGESSTIIYYEGVYIENLDFTFIKYLSDNQ